jgi:predicted ribosomally synthesized peptide with nif11-like leader
MSKENLNLFFEKAASDSALAEKLAALQIRYYEQLATLATEAGFAVSGEDFVEAAKTLNDEELAGVSGGTSFPLIASPRKII